MPQMPFSISSTSAEPAGPSVAAGGINWEDFNHPPLLRLWHFAPRELEPNARRVARVAHAAYWLLLTSLLVNLPASIGLAAAGVEGAPLNIMYSVFNVLIGGGVGIWAEMSLYKGVGKNLPSLMARYLAIWGVFTLAMLAFSVMPIANFNGWLRLRLVHDDATLSDGARARRVTHAPARPPPAARSQRAARRHRRRAHLLDDHDRRRVDPVDALVRRELLHVEPGVQGAARRPRRARRARAAGARPRMTAL